MIKDRLSSLTAVRRQVGSFPFYLACASVLAVFIPWQATRVAVCVLAACVLCRPCTAKRLLAHRSSAFLLLFFLFTGVVGAAFHNLRGVFSAAFGLAVAVICLYLRDVMTPAFWAFLLNWIRFCCFWLLIACGIDTARHLSISFDWRCTLWFCNCNYLASLLAGCIMICAYQVVTSTRAKPVSYLLAIGCAICLLFTASMFAFLEVLIGVSVLLSLTQKHRLFRLFLLICSIGGLLLLLMPQLFPRLAESTATTDNRILIWQDSVHYIPEHFWTGKGFFTFATLQTHYHTAHAHNFLLECLLSFGAIGSALLLLFFGFYYRVVFICERLLRKSHISAFILALTAAVLLHATVDMTMIWTQTALFYGLIMAGVGADEYTLRERRINRL